MCTVVGAKSGVRAFRLFAQVVGSNSCENRGLAMVRFDAGPTTPFLTEEEDDEKNVIINK